MRPRPAFLLTLVLVTAVGAPLPAIAGRAWTRSAAIRMDKEMETPAPLSDVWMAVTSAKGFCTLTGFTASDSQAVFHKVGDVVAASIWGDEGVLVCTAFVPGKELRVAFEPANGSYLCHKWIKLAAQAASTRVVVVDRYTDEQVDSASATAAKVAAESEQSLAAFKAMVEAKQ